MVRAEAHLIANDLVHGDLKDDQYFVGPEPARRVFLGDFGTAWRLLGANGRPLRLANREDQLERRAGVGAYKAPELRGRTLDDDLPLLQDVYAKAGGYSVGVVLYDVLGLRADGDVFDRLCDTNLEVELRAERGEPEGDRPRPRRRQPGWVYSAADLPALPVGLPDWLAEVMVGLVKSDHSEAERRLAPAEAVALLEVGGVAHSWERAAAAEATVDAQVRAAVTAAEQRAVVQRERAVVAERAQAAERLQVAVAAAEQTAAARIAAEQHVSAEQRRRRQVIETANAGMHQDVARAEDNADAERRRADGLVTELAELRRQLRGSGRAAEPEPEPEPPHMDGQAAAAAAPVTPSASGGEPPLLPLLAPTAGLEAELARVSEEVLALLKASKREEARLALRRKKELQAQLRAMASVVTQLVEMGFEPELAEELEELEASIVSSVAATEPEPEPTPGHAIMTGMSEVEPAAENVDLDAAQSTLVALVNNAKQTEAIGKNDKEMPTGTRIHVSGRRPGRGDLLPSADGTVCGFKRKVHGANVHVIDFGGGHEAITRSERVAKGHSVEYNSSTLGRWIPCKVQQMEADGTISLDDGNGSSVKAHAERSKIRRKVAPSLASLFLIDYTWRCVPDYSRISQAEIGGEVLAVINLQQCEDIGDMEYWNELQNQIVLVHKVILYSDVFDAMKSGVEVMKDMMKESNVDDLNDAMEEINEESSGMGEPEPEPEQQAAATVQASAKAKATARHKAALKQAEAALKRAEARAEVREERRRRRKPAGQNSGPTAEEKVADSEVTKRHRAGVITKMREQEQAMEKRMVFLQIQIDAEVRPLIV